METLIKNDEVVKETKSIIELRKEIDMVLEKQITNTTLQKKINDEFLKKGLNINVPSLLFQFNIDTEELKQNELISVSKIMFEYLGQDSVNPKDYFSPNELLDYSLAKPVKEATPTKVVFENVIKMDAQNYLVHIKPAQLAEIRLNNLVSYFKEFQRATRKVTLPNGEVIEKKWTNKESILAMKRRFKSEKKNAIIPTAVSFTVLKLEGKKPKVKFDKTFTDEIGTLTIEPNLDIDSPEYTPFIVTDGEHRTTAIVDAYVERLEETKDGKINMSCGLALIVTIATPDETSQYVDDVFKRNDTEEFHTATRTPSSDNKFIDMVVNNSEILKGNVARTFSDMESLNKVTYLKTLQDTMKYCGFDTANEIIAEEEAETVSKIIDSTIDYISKKYFNGDIDKLKETYLFKPHTFIGYLIIASKLVNNSNYKKDIAKISEMLFKQVDDKSLVKELKLDKSKYNLEEIVNFFKSLIKEAMTNE